LKIGCLEAISSDVRVLNLSDLQAKVNDRHSEKAFRRRELRSVDVFRIRICPKRATPMKEKHSAFALDSGGLLY